MRNITTLTLIGLLFVACKMNDSTEEGNQTQTKPDSIIKDIVKDTDENGCLSSAGYTWSKLNNECIKLFTGMQLNPIDNQENEDESISAYVLFSEDLMQAELFLPNENESIILKRDNNKLPWKAPNYELQINNGYLLKKAGKELFKGDGQMGKKVMGSETEQ
jgi:hypothetical protein